MCTSIENVFMSFRLCAFCTFFYSFSFCCSFGVAALFLTFLSLAVAACQYAAAYGRLCVMLLCFSTKYFRAFFVRTSSFHIVLNARFHQVFHIWARYLTACLQVGVCVKMHAHVCVGISSFCWQFASHMHLF